MIEIWKDVEGYEGLYQVSNLGNVRSLNWRRLGIVRNLYLKPHNKGYLQVELHRNSKCQTFTVHRLVAMHFVEGYEDGKIVNHKNEDKTDNHSENLEWVTYSYNNQYGSRGHLKSRGNHRRIPVIQYSMRGDFIKEWESPIEIKHKLGYSDWSIKECCKGKRKKAYGYRWQYAI